ncbi:hypothetical protein Pla175_50060 [Pirellulimonas nuda]|uniref:Glycerophosphoryl diester phosphodiesterase membrane domain-containing protein n=1 Tax=Pirellulimonas nuda TaxID=2528009 RepID=A0A518DJF7_9BACT|nr:hypothetical protein [Pirellulimonas nuda]QDU91576.1 hypothetical protein Pla175_50060 [Pirellulimonas nuda]
MNLDATHIAIRERSFSEILDLALRVGVRHAGPLLLLWAIGVLPFAAINFALLQGALSDRSLSSEPEAYVFWQLLLVVIEVPFATALMTLYLGQATFAHHVSRRRLAADFFRSLPQLLLLQGALRGLMTPLVLTLLGPYVAWPYLSELILLERNPLFAGRSGRISTMRRSRNLHRGAGGELFARWLAAATVGVLMTVSVATGVGVLTTQLTGVTLSDRAAMLYLWPAAAWAVLGYLAVVRFLAYLDLRIRREGWEVELAMRAEAAKLVRLS